MKKIILFLSITCLISFLSIHLYAQQSKFNNAVIIDEQTSAPKPPGNPTWSGDVDTDWFESGNWDNGTPAANKSIIIPSGCPNYPIINSGTINTKDITIESGGTMTMNGGIYYHSKDFVIDAGGSFVFNDGILHGEKDSGDPKKSVKNDGTFTQTGGTINSKDFENDGTASHTLGTINCEDYKIKGISTLLSGTINCTKEFRNEVTCTQSGGTINCKDFKNEKDVSVFDQSGSGSLITILHDYKNKGAFNSSGGMVKWTGDQEGGNGTIFNDGPNQFYNIQFEGPENPNIQKKGGTLLIRGDWTNNNPNLDLSSDETVNVIFNGNTPQTIGGTASTTFDNLEINTSGGAVVTLTGDQVVDTDLTITTGTLEINSVSTLTTVGTVTNNVGLIGLILKSDASGTASFIHNTSNVGATVERYLIDDRWHFIGIPVSNSIAGVFHLPSGHSDIYLRPHIESINTWGDWIVPDNTPLTLGQGYEVWVGTPAGFTQPETVQFQGFLNAGDYTTGSGGFYDLEYTSGHGLNLISNPFSSALEANINSWTKSNIANSVWTWSDDYGNYVYWNGTDGTGGGLGVGTLTGGIIPSMQGFFVLATGSNPSLTLPQTDQIHSSQAYYKESLIPENTLKLEVEGNNYKDVAFVSFNQKASDDFEDYDVKKMYGLDEAPQLYSIIPNEILSINTLSSLQNTQVVNLGFECATSDVFTISASELASFDKSVSIYLEDKTDGSMHDFNETSSYTFAHDLLNDADRFVLHFGAPNDINELQQDTEVVKIFAYENLVYVVPDNATTGNVFVYDLLGREIKNASLVQGDKTSISIDHQSGYFIVKVVTENSVVSEKVFIK